MLEIAGHQISRAGSLSTFKEDVVVRIGTCPDGLRGLDPKALLANGVECGGDYIFVAAESWTPDDFLVLGIHLPTDAKLNRAAGSKRKYPSRGSERL